MKVSYTVFDGEIVSETRGTTQRDYVPGANGNTVALLDNTGTVTDTISYWPCGEVKARIGSTPTPFQFGGTRGWYTQGKSIFVNPVYDPATASWRTPARARMQKRGRTKLSPQGIRYPGASMFNPFDARKFRYGHYCGESLFANPHWRIVPQDSIDECCRLHDSCLDGHAARGFSSFCAHLCCDCGLVGCLDKRVRDLSWTSSPMPGEALGAAFRMRAIFEAGCGLEMAAVVVAQAAVSTNLVARLLHVLGYTCPPVCPPCISNYQLASRYYWGDDGPLPRRNRYD